MENQWLVLVESQTSFSITWLSFSANHDLWLNTDIDTSFYFEDIIFPCFDVLFLENNHRLDLGGILEITESNYGR